MPKETFLNLQEGKRSAFLEAAITEFSDHTYEKVNIRAIVKKAGVSIGSFYSYFDSKLELFVYIADYMYEALLKKQAEFEKLLARKVSVTDVLEQDERQRSFWDSFARCSIDKRKHYYLRTDGNVLFDRFLSEIKACSTKSIYTEKDNRLIAFVMNAVPYIIEEYHIAEKIEEPATDHVADDEISKIKEMLLLGYQTWSDANE